MIGLEAGFCLVANSVLGLAILSVLKRSKVDDALRLTNDDGAMLSLDSFWADAQSDVPNRAAKNTIENGALHMNFPILEQAQVCLSSLQCAIVRMAHELFSGAKYRFRKT